MLKIVENLWAVGAPLRTPAGGAHSALSDPLAGGRGLLPFPKNPTSPPPLSAFSPSVLAQMENPGHAIGDRKSGRGATVFRPDLSYRIAADSEILFIEMGTLKFYD